MCAGHDTQAGKLIELVQSQYRAPSFTQVRPGFYRAFAVSAQSVAQ
jgi:hypothetical protein